MSFPALDAEHGGDMWPYIGFVGIPLMTLFAMIRGPRSAAGFAATTGMLFLLFFSFGKQAFNNYYFAVFSILCTAVAAYAPRGTIGWFRGK